MTLGEFDRQAAAAQKHWKTGVERIAIAFHKLPTTLEEHPMNYPSFRDIYGNYFMRMWRGPQTGGQRLFRQRQQPASRRITEQELKRLRSAVAETQAALDDVHRPTIETLMSRFNYDLFRFEIQHLLIILQNTQIAEISDGAGRGRPVDPYPLDVAIEVGRFYRFITGDHPTISTDPGTGKAGGKFIVVLTEVYDILGIRASAVSRARKAIDTMERIARQEKY